MAETGPSIESESQEERIAARRERIAKRLAAESQRHAALCNADEQ